MFSNSADSGISMPQLSPASFLGENETLLHYDHHDLLFHCLLENTTPPINKAVSSTKGPEVYPSCCGDHNRPLHENITRSKSEKKDRHSKIFTAKGPRGRRVRLSKDISRKFFDLQDLLGFNTASKTLDWLLTKSETAIKELTQMDYIDGAGQSLRSSSECENLDLDLKKSTVPPNKKKRMQNIPAKRKEAKALQMAAAFDAVAKELRAKARARARERTREKKFLREVTEDKKLPYISNQGRNWSQIESCKSSDSNSHNIESISSSTGMNGFFCLQPNLVISRESCSSNFSQWSPNTTENWDISSTVTSSSLCALTNTTSSTGLEISRKPFNFKEYSYNNERLMW